MNEQKNIKKEEVGLHFSKLTSGNLPENKRGPGLTLTHHDIIQIKLYAKEMLSLPTENEPIRVYLETPADPPQGLHPKDFVELFKQASQHGKKWQPIEDESKSHALNLSNFSDKMVSCGREAAENIQKMPTYIKAKEIIGGGDQLTPEQEEKLKSIKLVDNDKVAIQEILTDILEEITKAIQNERDRTKALTKNIISYKNELSNDIETKVQQKRILIDNTIKSQDAEINQLQTELKDVSDQLESRRQDSENYNNTLYVSMIGGAIGVSIEQSIFGGAAAENELKKNELKKRQKQIINNKKNKDMLRSQIELLREGFSNTRDRLNRATIALGHLDEVWERTDIQITESLESLQHLKDSASLVRLKIKIKKIYCPWCKVKLYVEQIITAFDKAIEVYNTKFK